MNRRELLRSMMGVAAATALPSELWPFRKIFLPAKQLPPLPPLFIPEQFKAYKLSLITGLSYTDFTGRFIEIPRIQWNAYWEPIQKAR